MRLDAFLAHLDQFVQEALLLQLPALEDKFQILQNQRVLIRKLLVMEETIFITPNAYHALLQAGFIFLAMEAFLHSYVLAIATELETQLAVLARP